MDKSEILEKVKILLNAQNVKISDEVLTIYVDRTIQYVLNYCNIYELPNELCYTVIDIIVNSCNRALSNSDNISSISEGGRTVSFINKLDSFIQFDKEQKQILNQFRVLYK